MNSSNRSTMFPSCTNSGILPRKAIKFVLNWHSLDYYVIIMEPNGTKSLPMETLYTHIHTWNLLH